VSFSIERKILESFARELFWRDIEPSCLLEEILLDRYRQQKNRFPSRLFLPGEALPSEYALDQRLIHE